MICIRSLPHRKNEREREGSLIYVYIHAAFDQCSMIFQIDISVKLRVYWAEEEKKENEYDVCHRMIWSSLFGKEDVSSLYVHLLEVMSKWHVDIVEYVDRRCNTCEIDVKSIIEVLSYWFWREKNEKRDRCQDTREREYFIFRERGNV